MAEEDPLAWLGWRGRVNTVIAAGKMEDETVLDSRLDCQFGLETNSEPESDIGSINISQKVSTKSLDIGTT